MLGGWKAGMLQIGDHIFMLSSQIAFQLHASQLLALRVI
jgi:hypothetical protein